MGGRGTHTQNRGSGNATAQQSTFQTRVMTQREQLANQVINKLKPNRENQSVSFRGPNNEEIRAIVQRVRNQNTGRNTYTVSVLNWDTGERLFYTYNRKSISDVKKDIRRTVGL